MILLFKVMAEQRRSFSPGVKHLLKNEEDWTLFVGVLMLEGDEAGDSSASSKHCIG